MEPRFIELNAEKTVASVKAEPFCKGNVFIARDRRKTFIILAQRMKYILLASDLLANEEISQTRAYCQANKESSKTCGSFTIDKIGLRDVREYLEEHRRKYERLIIVASNAAQWRVAQCK